MHKMLDSGASLPRQLWRCLQSPVPTQPMLLLRHLPMLLEQQLQQLMQWPALQVRFLGHCCSASPDAHCLGCLLLFAASSWKMALVSSDNSLLSMRVKLCGQCGQCNSTHSPGGCGNSSRRHTRGLLRRCSRYSRLCFCNGLRCLLREAPILPGLCSFPSWKRRPAASMQILSAWMHQGYVPNKMPNGYG